MNKADIISKLTANNYSFEDKGDIVIVKLTRWYFLKLYFENDIIVKNLDTVKQLNLWTNGKSLKTVIKINLIFFIILILPFTLWCIFNPSFYSNGGKFFIIIIYALVLNELLVFLFYYKCLKKIKKLLKLNE